MTDEKTALLKYLGTTLMRVDNLDLDKLEVRKNRNGIKIDYGRFNFTLVIDENDNLIFAEMDCSNSYNSNWENDIDFIISQTKLFLSFQENLEKIKNLLIDYLKNSRGQVDIAQVKSRQKSLN